MINNVIMPKLSHLMKKGRIEEILVKEGQAVKKGDAIVLVSAEKANAEIEAISDGYVSIKCELHKEYFVGEVLSYIVSSVEELTSIINTEQIEKESSDKDDNKEKIKPIVEKPVRALPIAKRLAIENGLDLSMIDGTGHNGLITKEDVERHIENRDDSIEIIELDSVKKSMVEHMELTHSYVKGSTFMDIDLHLVKKARLKNKHSYTSYIAHAVAKSLIKYPLINSTFQDGKIYVNKHINLGIALDNNGKLFVPVIKDANEMEIKDIEERIKLLQEKAKNNRISFDDLSDGTFSLTNSGIFGSLFFSPIINYPQSAIMGIGKIADRAVVYDNAINIRPIMIVSLSYDHRIIEGSIAVKFLASVKEYLENSENLDL